MSLTSLFIFKNITYSADLLFAVCMDVSKMREDDAKFYSIFSNAEAIIEPAWLHISRLNCPWIELILILKGQQMP